MATPALEIIDAAARAGDGGEFRAGALGYPAIGAKEISPERRAKIQAALKREARRIGYRFLFLHFKAELHLARLRIAFTLLAGVAKLQRRLRKLVARVAHSFPR